MTKAIWKDTILADSEKTILVEGNHYFPPDSIDWDHFCESATHTRCHWKGTASYYHVIVDGEINRDAAWSYPDPSEAAFHIKGSLGFWRGVCIELD